MDIKVTDLTELHMQMFFCQDNLKTNALKRWKRHQWRKNLLRTSLWQRVSTEKNIMASDEDWTRGLRICALTPHTIYNLSIEIHISTNLFDFDIISIHWQQCRWESSCCSDPILSGWLLAWDEVYMLRFAIEDVFYNWIAFSLLPFLVEPFL